MYKHVSTRRYKICNTSYFKVLLKVQKLAVPNVSNTFWWNGSEVASIAKQGAIYIRSLIPLAENDDSDDYSETENEVGLVFIYRVYFLITLQLHVKN